MFHHTYYIVIISQICSPVHILHLVGLPGLLLAFTFENRVHLEKIQIKLKS